MPARSPEETHALLAEALNNGDLDALVEVYEENAALIVPPDGKLATGRSEIRRALQPTLALGPTVTLDVVRKLESDLALTHGRWNLVGTKSLSGTAVTKLSCWTTTGYVVVADAVKYVK